MKWSFSVFPCRLFTDICKTADDCDEILFGPDGTWAPFAPPGKDVKSHSTTNSGNNGIIRQSPHKLSPVKLNPGPLPASLFSSTWKFILILAIPTIVNLFSVGEEVSEKPAVDVIVLSDSDDDDDDDKVSDSSSIQPIRTNKRPISAISSDSSTGLENGTSSFLPPYPTNSYGISHLSKSSQPPPPSLHLPPMSGPSVLDLTPSRPGK